MKLLCSTSLQQQNLLSLLRCPLVAQATPSQREEGSGHAATVELFPWQKLDVTNQIRALRNHCHGVQLRRNVFSRCQHLITYNHYV